MICPWCLINTPSETCGCGRGDGFGLRGDCGLPAPPPSTPDDRALYDIALLHNDHETERVIAERDQRITALETEVNHLKNEIHEWEESDKARSILEPIFIERIAELKRICAEAYQVVGALAFTCGVDCEHLMDNLSQQRLVHEDVLPFTPPKRMEELNETGRGVPMVWEDGTPHRYQ